MRTPAQLQSFDGAHQAALLSEPTAATVFVAFDVTASSQRELRELLRTITARMQALHRGGLPAYLGPASPPDDNGLLGPRLPERQVAFLLGFGSTLFDGRFGLAGKRPAKLTTMPTFPNDDLRPALCGGDLSIQICADDVDTVVHALRDLTKHTRGGMQSRWRDRRLQEPAATDRDAAQPARFQGRHREPRDRRCRRDEPARLARKRRRRARLDARGHVPGRARDPDARRVLGSRLAQRAGDDDRPPPRDRCAPRCRPRVRQARLPGGPARKDHPAHAHIRLANPRTAGADHSRILRRGWNYDAGTDTNGNLDQGLLFTCYQQDIERQFAAVQRRLVDEPLVDYVSPIGGGYFFCPPGLAGRAGYLGSGLV